MKKIFVFALLLVAAVTTSAQSIVRTGLYREDGRVVYSNPKSEITVCVTVKSIEFTPGEFARYAQKLLGVRASLAQRSESEILSATISATAPVAEAVNIISEPAKAALLPAFRMNNSLLSAEQQAEMAADMIFDLRRHRKELITGEAGENVFGAGLTSALEQIEAMEQQCLELFYGTEQVKVVEHRFTVEPQAAESNYIICRYKKEGGIVPLSDLSGEPMIVCIYPSEVDMSLLTVAAENDKTAMEYVVPADCRVELLCGTRLVANGTMPIYQYGKKLRLIIPAK